MAETAEPFKPLEPFEFKQCTVISKFTGRRAKNLRELRDLMASVGDESISHHTYQYFLKGRVHEYTNDFAYWAGESLEERALSEQLSSVDSYSFRDVTDLRTTLMNVVDDYLKALPGTVEVIPGNEFYFSETVTLVFPVGIKAHNLAEFLTALKYVDPSSIYYHFYEARIRLRSGIDDFSSWIKKALDKTDLAERIKAIDPFMHNLEGIRQHLIEYIEEEVRKDMEVIIGA